MNRTRTLGRAAACSLAFAAAAIVAPAAVAQNLSPQATQPAATQSGDYPAAEKIIEKAVEAMGGRKVIENVKNVRVVYDVTVGRQSMVMDVAMSNDKSEDLETPPMFARTTVMGMMIEAGTNGRTAWSKDPMDGSYRVLEGPQARDLAAGRNLIMPLAMASLKENAKSLKTIGEETFNGKPAWKVQIEPKDGQRTNTVMMFAKDDGTLLGWNVVQPGSGNMTATIVRWAEHEGLMFAEAMKQEQAGRRGLQTAMEMTLKEVQVDTVDPATFELPEPVRKMVGDEGKGAGNAPANTGGGTTRPGTNRGGGGGGGGANGG